MDEQVQKRLRDLFLTYTKNLPGKIENIEKEWESLALHWNATALTTFHRNVHSLCGSAGTYGYIQISKAARELEITIKSFLGESELSETQKMEIAEKIASLKKIFALSKAETITQNTEPKNPQPLVDNKLIYIVEQDIVLISDLSESLKHVGYELKPFYDLHFLKNAIKEQVPIAMILNTDYLKGQGIEMVHEIQKQQNSPIQLFCILSDGQLLPRIEAVRAGSTAFFQKPMDIFHVTQILNQKCTPSGEPYRILIVDDSESLGEYYSLILNQAGMLAHAIANPLKLLEELESFQPDLLLLDVYMPECSGLELAAVLRQESNYTKIPIIFLSTEDDQLKKLSAMNLGGDDFLTKPILPAYLISAVRSRSKRASALNYYMNTDSLTGLLNHASFLSRTNTEFQHARENNLPLTFVMIDIDHFKSINDRYGHPAGDLVLKKMSTLFSLRLRAHDVIGRYGGEEFALLLPGSSMEQSLKICNTLREQFAQFPFSDGKEEYFVSFSAGISQIRADNDVKILISEADKALYRAKQLGRNQVICFGGDKDE